MENEIEKFKSLSESFKYLTGKVKLYSLLNIAKDEYKKYDYESSRKTLSDALKHSDTDAAVYRGLGCVEQFSGNYEKALEYFFKGLKYSDSKEIEYTLIGMVYYLMENLENAIKYFELAIKENDDYKSAYEGRNQAMLEYHLKIVDLQEALDKLF